MSEITDTSNDSNSLSSSGSLLQSARLGSGNPVRGAVLRPSVLGASVLGSTLSSSNTTTSNDEKDVKENNSAGVVKNPFLKEQTEDDNNDVEAEASASASTSKSEEKDKLETEDEEQEERSDPLTLLRKNGIERVNLFAAAKSAIPRVESSGFVFGQNVHERVLGDNVGSTDNNTNSENHNSSENSTSELLFSSVIQKAAKDTADKNDGAADTEAKSLTEVAREYEESRAQKRKFEEVETFTGEENEINIADISCKLFAFVNSNWEERGRGSLRLNDSKDELECSRVVFRTSGNLRLLLNTKIWAGMVAERPSQKSLRLTAMDNTGKIKIFLAMARPVDIAQLHKALVERIEKRKKTHPEECSAAAGSGDASSKNSTENGASVSDAQNGNTAVSEDEHAKAAKLSEPDEHCNEECNEPSPKKPVVLPVKSDSDKKTEEIAADKEKEDSQQ